MKHKRFSTAILCGFKKVDGRQHFGDFSNRDERALAVCVMGAAALCETGDPHTTDHDEAYRCRAAEASDIFRVVWGLWPTEANDSEQLPWEHIYGMAVAAGL